MDCPYDIDTIAAYEDIMVTVAPSTVATALLRPTQSLVRIDRLLALAAGSPCEGPDPVPHVVAFDDALWVHNGHHRWLLALLRGEPTLEVRIAPVKVGALG